MTRLSSPSTADRNDARASAITALLEVTVIEHHVVWFARSLLLWESMRCAPRPVVAPYTMVEIPSGDSLVISSMVMQMLLSVPSLWNFDAVVSR